MNLHHATIGVASVVFLGTGMFGVSPAHAGPGLAVKTLPPGSSCNTGQEEPANAVSSTTGKNMTCQAGKWREVGASATPKPTPRSTTIYDPTRTPRSTPAGSTPTASGKKATATFLCKDTTAESGNIKFTNPTDKTIEIHRPGVLSTSGNTIVIFPGQAYTLRDLTSDHSTFEWTAKIQGIGTVVGGGSLRLTCGDTGGGTGTGNPGTPSGASNTSRGLASTGA